MPAKKSPNPGDVETYLASLEHPSKPELLALRQLILGADPAISEGVKWNAPSFRTTEWFATFHLRERAGVRLILHLGAKARPGPGLVLESPLLDWLGRDRASVVFRDAGEVEARARDFTDLIRRWIVHV
ncbi:DUF1801 domain-containing protein [Paludisphaera soli]|uniref:DUF1801 domain-containing protein n=1 Tax=Paludisphaera soli TaxID=2712865 RepID=UPI0013EBAD47|nr:DUF1801 domain-containing protein [Paludisphaera soli]